MENNSLFNNGTSSSIFNDVFMQNEQQQQHIFKSSIKRSQSWSHGLNLIDIERQCSQHNDDETESIVNNNNNYNNSNNYTINKSNLFFFLLNDYYIGLSSSNNQS